MARSKIISRFVLRSAFLFTAGAAIAGAAAVAGAQEAGRTVAVNPDALAVGQEGSRELAPQAPVNMNERVRTGPVGEAQIRLSDDTKLVVGPNSLLLIDKFVFSGPKTALSVSINALRGTARFISGDSPKQVYNIRTPTAILGIRGTKFDLSVAENGDTIVLMLEGSARVCNVKGGCVVARSGCGAVMAPAAGGVRTASTPERNDLIRTAFPYVANQEKLNPAFRADTSGCGDVAALRLPVAAATEVESRAGGTLSNVRSASPN